MRFIGWLFAAVLLILLGWIGGPVGMAAYRLATKPYPEAVQHQISDDLVRTYESEIEGHYRLNLSINIKPDYAPIKACGYDPREILGEEKVPFLLSTDWGTEVLRIRAGLAKATIEHELRTDYVVTQYSPLALVALTQCIDTPFAPMCRGQIRGMIAAADAQHTKKLSENKKFLDDQDQAILCTFLDGAAARRGIAKTAAATKPAP